MKTIVYKNYDSNCKHFKISKIDPFGHCFNPSIFSSIGINNHWVVNCKDCNVRDLDVVDFQYKLSVLEVKIKEELQNGTK